MIKFSINKDEVDKRIDNLIARKFNVSKNLIFKLLRTKKITINHLYVDPSYKTKLNDDVIINYNFENNNQIQKNYNYKFKKKLNIIYEDDNIILINKQIGILSQPINKDDLSIQNLLIQYLIETKQYHPNKTIFVPSICNRLDFNTSGIIIAAKNNQALVELNNLIKEHQIEKFYKVLVFGKPPQKHAVIKAYHYKDQKTNLVYIKDKFEYGYKEIITEYNLLKSNLKWSLLEVKLITGKTHQIRAHLNHLGLNIVGEQKYKNKKNNFDNRFKSQALVSYKIKFHTDKNSVLNYLNQKTFRINDIWFEKFFNS